MPWDRLWPRLQLHLVPTPTTMGAMRRPGRGCALCLQLLTRCRTTTWAHLMPPTLPRLQALQFSRRRP
eukprot:6189632-Pleurochrysis_carterae.AAC.3